MTGVLLVDQLKKRLDIAVASGCQQGDGSSSIADRCAARGKSLEKGYCGDLGNACMVGRMGQFMEAGRGFRAVAQFGENGSRQHVGNEIGTVG